MLLTVKRGNENINLTVKPQMDDIGVYRMGVKIKDSAGGLGTMTYIDPKTGAFGGLGHGICEITGKLTPITGGKVTDVDITGVKKGEVGTPGELCGILQHKKQGSLVSNTDSGVFGTLIEVPHIKPMPIALSHEVKTGKATIISTLANDAREEYDIEITAINRNGHIKSMMLKVTDPDLLSKTGGIVQGMSGSPIIQNGKIIGAVTHVLVNDPTAGYGIFIENMLKSMPEILQP